MSEQQQDDLELLEVEEPKGPQYKPEELYDMIAEYSAICHSLGIDTRRMTPMDLYLTTGRIFEQIRRYRRPVPADATLLEKVQGPTAIKTIEELTRQERLLIRDRVLGVVQLQKK
jgi:hypothetical protein